MHTLTIKVDDRVFDKVIYFLNNLPKQDIEIVSNKTIKIEKEDDFIYSLTQNPIEVSDDLKFLTREEANER